MSSVEPLPSVFCFNAFRVAQSIIKSSDCQVVVKGFLLAIVVRHSHRLLVPVSTGFMGLVLLGFILGIIGTAHAAASSYLDISRVALPRQDLSGGLILPPGFRAKAYLPSGINKITSIAFDSRDRLFVASQNGVVVRVDDADADGVGDGVWFFANKDGTILRLAISEDDKTVYIAGGGDVLIVETPEEVTDRVEGAMEFAHRERITLNPDCGFSPSSANPMDFDGAYLKLRAMCEGVRMLPEK